MQLLILMVDIKPTISYPRKIIIRSILKGTSKLVISSFFRIYIYGKENFPTGGPLIIVGNHTAVMEAVLLILFSPWQIEMLGAADIPHERISRIFSDLYGYIPVNRGHFDRAALRYSLSILDQKGIIGIFPEGGIWEPGLMRAQTGVSWLSYHGKTPVLPIGFSGTFGSIDNALKLKRPKITMQIGQLIPYLRNEATLPRKVLFQQYAEDVMTRVRKLILAEDPYKQKKIKDECFKLSIAVNDKNNLNIPIPEDKKIVHETSLVRFLHRPTILKLFYSNLNLPIEALLKLDQTTDPQIISNAVFLILHYLENENPYLLTYRFGPKMGEEMKLGLQEFYELSQWVSKNKWELIVKPIRKYYSLEENKVVIQTRPNKFQKWM